MEATAAKDSKPLGTFKVRTDAGFSGVGCGKCGKLEKEGNGGAGDKIGGMGVLDNRCAGMGVECSIFTEDPEFAQ
jgi:hypothetical protein